MAIDFREREGGVRENAREGERERNIDVREKHGLVAPLSRDWALSPQPRFVP